MTDVMFERQGSAWVPTAASRGPWGDSLHGGAPAALLTYVLDGLPNPPGPLARLTLDLFRPVPFAPLEVSVTPLRVGRRLAVQEAMLTADGTPLVRAVAVHGDEHPVVPGGLPADGLPPMPSLDVEPECSLVAAYAAPGYRRAHGEDGLHHRLLVRRGPGAGGSGSNAAWLRLPLDLAPGIPLSPMAHLGGCSDFANGLAQRLVQTPDGSFGFINADISLHVLRAPAAQRFAMFARNEVHAGGRAVVSAECYDEDGLLARITQTALVMART